MESGLEGQTLARALIIYDGRWPAAAVNHSSAPLENTVTAESAFLACLLRPTWNLSRHCRWYVIPRLSEGKRSQPQTLAKELRLFNSGGSSTQGV